ncbi:MAG: LCP family protein [Clostridia bacterium]|nr:LCP family protein [Clostridia bacterium]
MVCKECGKRLKAGQTVCPSCGAIAAESVSLGSLSANQKKARAKKPKKKLSGTDLALRIALISVSVLAVLGILFGILYIWARSFIDDNANIDEKFTEKEQQEMHVNTDLPTPKEGILNIALFGLDERGETDEKLTANGKTKSFHSDAIIILTIDRRDKSNPRVKMSSLARDTLVYVEGYNSKNSMTKLAHAFQYGYNKAKAADKEKKYTQADYKREGAKTAIKTINYNFHMNITEYMYVNFVEFMDIIDYVGGVTINVQQRELNELNKHVRAMEKECGRDLTQVKKAGEQTLNGGQALAYSRIRKIDSDLKRTNRQRDVLKGVFNKVKTTPINKLPDVIAKMLSLCHTTLTSEEILELGTWAVTNSPEIINYTLPDTSVKNWIWEGTHPNYNWVWIYDLDYASALLIDFIFDKETAKDLPKPTMPNEPKVTAAPQTSATGGGNPTDPVDPTNPVDPTVPSGSITLGTGDPTATGEPTGGTDPSGSTDPTGTGGSTGGTDPSETGVIGTVNPTDPTVPTQPTQPTQPVDPTDPVSSTTPGLGTSTPTSSTQIVMP